MRYFELLATVLLAGLFLGNVCGCKSESATATPSKAELAPRVLQGKEFVATLKSMPVAQRQAYVAKHQDIVQSLSTTGDPQLTTQFMQLMRESQPRK